MEKIEAFLFLKNLKGVGNVAINKKYAMLIKEGINKEELIQVVRQKENKLNDSDIDYACQKAKEEYELLVNDVNIQVVTVIDNSYPKKLNVMQDKKPVILYYAGNFELLNKTGIAIVGTRKPSEESIKAEEGIVKKIKHESDYAIISGLALGCDTIAHESALKYEAGTVAVLPSGINHIYPAANKKLADSILKSNGLLISEYYISEQATKYTMVERDGLIAALSDATLVIECGVKSGTMHTVDAAKKFLRRVACYVPAAYGDSYEGNKMLLNEKSTASLSSSQELMDFIEKMKENNEPIPVQMTLFDIEE